MAKVIENKVEPSGKPNKKRGIVMIVAVAAVAAAVAGGAVYFMAGRSGLPEHAAKAPPAEAAVPIFVPIEPLTVNLQSEDRPHYLRIGVMLRVRDEHAREQATQYAPEARNRMLVLLSNRKPDSLLGAEDKNRLADEIMKELNKPFFPNQPTQRITGVMFTEFMVQ